MGRGQRLRVVVQWTQRLRTDVSDVWHLTVREGQFTPCGKLAVRVGRPHAGANKSGSRRAGRLERPGNIRTRA